MRHTHGKPRCDANRVVVTPRALAATLVAALALAAPNLARAGDVPPSLIAQAQANPNQTFEIIVQTAGSGSPVNATVGAIASAERKAASDAVPAASWASPAAATAWWNEASWASAFWASGSWSRASWAWASHGEQG